jgi:hypothetical protein
MRTKKEKDIVVKAKMLSDTGLILSADGKQFVIAADYKFRAKTFGEVEEWGGTLTTLGEIPMDGEYTLELDQEEDGRSGKIKLDSVEEKKQGKVTVYEYTFRGVTALG